MADGGTPGGRAADLAARPGAGTLLRARLPLGLLVLASACAPRVETLEIVSPDNRVLRSRGQKAELQAIARDRHGHVLHSPELSWRSSAPDVVSVTGEVAVALRSGRAVVQVSSGGARASSTFHVSIPARITVRPQTAELDGTNPSVPVELTVKDDAGRQVRDAAVVWASSDPAIARVEDGRIVGSSMGLARLTASAGEAQAEVEVRVFRADLARIAVQPSRHVFDHPGQTIRLKALGYSAKGAPLGEVPAVWAVSGSGVATVDETGTVTATGRGRALVSARAVKRRAAVEVYVK